MYKIKVYLGNDIGWLYIVGDNMLPREYTLEDAKIIVREYENKNNKYYQIIDEHGDEYLI